MRFRSRYALLVVGALSVACQTNTTTVGTRPPAPQNLTYRLDPSGDPNNPAGILLSWDNDTTSSLASYKIYSRGSTNGSYGLHAITPSITIHYYGHPHRHKLLPTG